MRVRSLFKRSAPILAIAASLLLSAACGSEASTNSADSTDTPATTVGASAVGTLTNADGWPRVEGLRGKRYCEVLLLRIIEGRLNAVVWNSFGLNDCPDAAWKALDPAAIKAERGVLAALLNGPRYWLMDAIEKKPGGERQESDFGSIRMFNAATVDLGPPPPNLAPYTERVVARETVFEFAKGSEVYELVAADGRVFIMQAYSIQNDPTLTEAGLRALATKIKPPEGWTYRVRTLDSVLRVLSQDSQATVVQDDLSNTYQLVASN